ncbi:uncharacterized protein LOC111303404 [Durio zibethinus]|uniref:Uncharacterized protein LOC111303404 n=1 Tax=Durio zibethinus TaxID=66656 RepID=A0A6P5ZR81_DURZI|nr:uncharacterized protein LOC111303404 [Durio zibethinus]
MASSGCSILALAVAAVFSASSAISFYIWKKKWVESDSKMKELQKSLNSALEKCAAERQGRIRAQQALRKAIVAEAKSENLEMTSYPMAPIGIIQSCFSTRNGTPRQPLLVPLARACLVFDSARVPPASLEGLEEYSHCWIIFVFHLNTDLEKLWKHPSKSKFKAKVRVPRLKGGRMGVFATRSPHRPCPIGLTVAKVEAVQGNMLLLSGVDLVDGTPVLDVKPYLPYCDSIEGAVVPNWVTVDSILSVASVSFSDDFSSSLQDCWKAMENKSLYSSPDELKSLVKQVLSWDIRSLSQQNRPHDNLLKTGNGDTSDNTSDLDDFQDGEASGQGGEELAASGEVIYHLILDGMDFSYEIDCNGNVIVEKVHLSSVIPFGNQKRCNYLMWKDKLK